ncbi:MAG: alpha/beta fold hydrolase [Gammaproteobacteria bacterium]
MTDSAASAALHRSFVTITGAFGTRQVHYRRGGRGPAVLLLHQSPQSSREMEPLIEAWGKAFTLIAPDSPGYGFSDPLLHEGRPAVSATMEDLARATLEFADALGLGRFGIYGFHTGASIGTALAEADPGRVAAVAANGLVVLSDAERESILRDYLPPFIPRWDGGHLAWLWGRLREQTIFFPWHDRRAATRMDFDVPAPERLQEALNEFLAAGDNYPVAYAAAFSDRADRRLPDLKVPLLVTASARDPLAGHLERIGARSASVEVACSPDGAAALDRCFAHLQSHPGDAPTLRAGGNTGASEYRGAPGRQVRLVRTGTPDGSGPGERRIVVLLHAPGSSAASIGPLSRELLASNTTVLAVDLPGHGASDPPPAMAIPGATLEATTRHLADALASLTSGTDTTVTAIGDSALIGIELARRLGTDTRVAVLDPTDWSALDTADWLRLGLPALDPVWSGGHLLEAWHLVRDSRLFSPWFRREHGGIRPGEPDLDDQRIQQDVRDLLRARGTWQALLRDVLQRDGDGPGLRS